MKNLYNSKYNTNDSFTPDVMYKPDVEENPKVGRSRIGNEKHETVMEAELSLQRKSRRRRELIVVLTNILLNS